MPGNKVGSSLVTVCRHYMALHLEHIPLSTQGKALKVVNLCEQYQLKEQGELMAGKQYKCW